MSTETQARQLFTELQPGDRVEIIHEVKVGSSKTWSTKTVGTVVNTERRRQGLHYRRSVDDKVFADMIKLKRDDGELTTITMDEFTELRRLS
jgi:(p)ppGpp synthase/HD superfamily hydrolase